MAGMAIGTPPFSAAERSTFGCCSVASVTCRSPRIRAVNDTWASSRAAVKLCWPGLLRPTVTCDSRKVGWGSSRTSIGPAIETGAPAASVSFASMNWRWLFQSMKYGPTNAVVSTIISRMARTVMLSRTAGYGRLEDDGGPTPTLYILQWSMKAEPGPHVFRDMSSRLRAATGSSQGS